MRIYPLRSKFWAIRAVKCLNIDFYCTLCARQSDTSTDLCAACEKLLIPLRHTYRTGMSTLLCLQCGVEYPIGQTDEPGRCVPGVSRTTAKGSHRKAAENDEPKRVCCSSRQCKIPLFRDIVAPYRYTHPIDGLIKRVKYRQDRQLSRVLGTLLAEAVRQRVAADLPQSLVPMPLHPVRQNLRGFNQAHDIAHWTGKRLGVPVAGQSVSRVVDTGSLAGVSRAERQHRILGAFRAEDSLFGQRVAIVDDVLTTGASARELAREIYDCGAASVELWVLARTSSLRSGN